MPLEGGGKALFGLREELPAVMPGGDSPTSMDIGGKIRNSPCKNLCTVSGERSGFFEQCLGNSKMGKRFSLCPTFAVGRWWRRKREQGKEEEGGID